MADVLRSCTKTGCRWPAAASLSYRYATRQVWLLDLSFAPDPSLYDLCPHHADHLVVPKGWERVDDRTPQEVMVEPSAFDRAEAARLRQPTTISARGRELVSAGSSAPRNRYAELVEQLPRLAAEAAAYDAPASGDEATEEPASSPAEESAPALDPVPVVSGAVRPPLPSRDLAPMPAGEPLWRETADTPPAPPTDPPVADTPVPGQLAIPVDDLIEASGGVVVAFDFAGGRRRNPRS